MFYQLAPAGNRIRFTGRGAGADDLAELFAPYLVNFFDSGTSALAAAVRVAQRARPVKRPEVLLPAYGCPDLISAILYAGASPVLVDLEKDRPFMDLEQLERKVSERTVAIIAVDLFGLEERLEAIRAIGRRAGAVVIEDSAQYFPAGPEGLEWKGDLIVLSFGRGKPVSLLGGGAILCREPHLQPAAMDADGPSTARGFAAPLFILKALVYNLLLSPRLYWLPSALPFLGLGQTRFKPLERMGALADYRARLLHGNIIAYRASQSRAQGVIAAMLRRLQRADVVDLAAQCSCEHRRLVRYPVLVANEELRNSIYKALHSAGLGASTMYPGSLTEIRGVRGVMQVRDMFPNAESFSRRILTLPTHAQVKARDLGRIEAILRQHTACVHEGVAKEATEARPIRVQQHPRDTI